MKPTNEVTHLMIATGHPDTCKGMCGVTEGNFTVSIQGVNCPACRLRYWRQAEGLNRNEAAAVLGVSNRTIEKWEVGGSIPHPMTFILTNALSQLWRKG